jgi:short-subunit dehydrogenase
MVRLNALTPLEVVYKFARPMVERRRGGILLVGSLACAAGNAHMSLYGASKSFMNRLTESLWVQLAESNVDVLCYVAGLTLTTGLLRHKEENDAKGLQTSNFDMASAATPEQVIEESFQSLLNRRGPLRGPGAVPHYDWEAHRWVAGTDEETRQRADVVWDFNKEFVGRYGLPPLTDPRPAGA